MSHESGQLYDGLFCRGGLVNTKVSRNSGWRHKWVIYIVTRPRGSAQTWPWAQPRLHSPPQRTHSPRLLYCSFLWQRSAQRLGLLIVNSQSALMEIEKKKKKKEEKKKRGTRVSLQLHDVFMVTGAPGSWFFFPGGVWFAAPCAPNTTPPPRPNTNTHTHTHTHTHTPT